MEANNMKVMREASRVALEKVNEIYDILSKPCIVVEEARQACREARGVLIPALALPPRQCDVGTAKEQAERFIDYCCRKCDGSKCKHGLYREDELYKCAIKWAQMPHVEKKEDDCGKSGE